MAAEELRRDKARNLRYKKAILARLNYEGICNELSEMSETCNNYRYYFSDDETILNALDGDEDEAEEFRNMFCDLSAKCEQLNDCLYDSEAREYFDDCVVGIVGNKYEVLGYDGYEEDYFSLCQYESGLASTESGKRLMTKTKAEMISIAGQCLGVILAYLDIVDCYNNLKCAFDVLRESNTEYLNLAKNIDVAYSAAAKEDFGVYNKSTREYDELVSALPDRAWLE